MKKTIGMASVVAVAALVLVGCDGGPPCEVWGTQLQTHFVGKNMVTSQVPVCLKYAEESDE